MGWSRKRPWSNAVPTVADGIRFRSGLESRVYVLLKATLVSGDAMFYAPRFPLIGVAPLERHKPLYFTPDFVIRRRDRTVEVYDAKSGRVSRDWARGKAMFQESYGWEVREVKA